MEMLDSIMKWVVAPVTAFVWVIYQRQADHHTDIAVIKSQIDIDKTHHDREMKEMRDTVKAIFSKLDSIESSFRNKV
jgi:hypothetical protein